MLSKNMLQVKERQKREIRKSGMVLSVKQTMPDESDICYNKGNKKAYYRQNIY